MSVTLDYRSMAPFIDGRPKKLLIDGDWKSAESGETFDSYNPSTGEIIAQIAAGDLADVNLAVDAARRAFDGPWRRFTPAQRQNMMLKMAELLERSIDELALLDVLEMGHPIGAPFNAAVNQIVIDSLRYYAGWATKIHGETVPNSMPGSLFSYTLKEPVGVVGSIIPWNGPTAAAVLKIAPVLATGCTIVLKPAEEASLSAIRLGELIQELDIPPGVINIVTGFGETAGAAITAHPDVDKVSFTGSSFTGQEIVRSAIGNLKRVSLELGGKSPDIVFADANLDMAVPGASMAVFANSGQVCAAGTRVFVERPIYDEFVAGMSAFADSLKVGNSLDPNTQIGPIVSQNQLDRVTGYLAVGKAEGARRRREVTV